MGTYECLVELKNGEEYFITTRKLDNREAYNRERESDMDEFMEDNNDIKSKAERRDAAIDSLISDGDTVTEK